MIHRQVAQVVTHVNVAGVDVVAVLAVDGLVAVDWDWLEYHTTIIIWNTTYTQTRELGRHVDTCVAAGGPFNVI